MSIVERETERVVIEKHPMFRCNQCGTEVIPPYDDFFDPPKGWIVFFDGPETPMDRDRLHACSWTCLRNYADDRANDETLKVSV